MAALLAFARQVLDDIRQSSLRRMLREIAHREGDLRRQLAILARPIAPPPDLLAARRELSALSAETEKRLQAKSEAEARVTHLVQARPAGFFGWLTGRARTHGAVVQRARDKLGVVSQAFQIARIAQWASQSRLSRREDTFDRDAARAEADCATVRRSLEAELAWIADARRVVETNPDLAHAPQTEFARAVQAWRAAYQPAPDRPAPVGPRYRP